MDKFCDNLKKERQLNGLTQAQMAEKLGIPINTYRNYESKNAKNNRHPDLDMLVKIADILEVTTDYLLGRDEV